MKPKPVFLLVLLVFALAQAACNLPSRAARTATPDLFATLVATVGTPAASVTPNPSATTPPGVTVTATPTDGQAGGGVPATGCSYLATFVADVTVPDDTRMTPGQSFAKSWRVRNDGTCTWGAGYPLHSLAFTGGSKLGAPDQVEISGSVGPGQLLDVSVNMVAPASPGVYTSEWKFRIDNAPAGVGPYLGVGAGRAAPLFTRIIVGSTPISGVRIRFPSGATAASVEGQVSAGGSSSYVLSAAKGQLLIAQLASAAQDLTLRVLNAQNQQVLAGNSMNVQTVLPSTGDYIIQVLGGSQAGAFALGVTIPARITFAPGAVSASVDGKIVAHFATTYLLRALANQTMTVKVTSPSNAVALTIYGLDDGQPLLRAESGQTNWSGTLPATQDYVIMVVPAVDSTTFTLTTRVE